MKVGVVCEGMTDFHAINHYVGAALGLRGLSVDFVALQPAPDNTTSGGWGNVFSWLEGNPPESRESLFGRGLFANSKKMAGLDLILIHIDTDVLPERSFLNFLHARNYSIGNPINLVEQCDEISKLIAHFAKFNQCPVGIAEKHVAAPIAESSEAWCVAVDPEFRGVAEELSGQDLINAFGAAHARFNGIPVKAAYSSINKKIKSREKYCQGTVGEVNRLDSCSLFVALVQNIATIAQ